MIVGPCPKRGQQYVATDFTEADFEKEKEETPAPEKEKEEEKEIKGNQHMEQNTVKNSVDAAILSPEANTAYGGRDNEEEQTYEEQTSTTEKPTTRRRLRYI